MTDRQAESERSVSSRPEDEGGKGTSGMVSFRKDDMQVFLKMAEEEESMGNTTGADMYRSIADKMQNIMSRSNARLMSSLDLEENSDDVKRWPFLHSGLATQGKTVWVTDGASETLKSARGLNAYGPGGYVQWKLRIAELQGTMSVGLTSLKVDLDSSWRDPEHFNEAFYITHNGNLYNGGELVHEGEAPLRAGDELTVSIDGDGVFFSVNGKELSACLKPLTGSVRLSVQMKKAGDGLTLLDELVVDESQSSESRVSAYSTTTLTRSLDDEEEISLLSKITTDSSETSEEEGEVAPQPVGDSKWEMVVDETTKRVYYWNKKTQETTWDRPADFLGISERAFLDSEKETSKLLKKTADKKLDVFSDNADGERDSHTTVQFDEDGYPALDRFVYVDEATCIGCTNCATVARSTFFMEQMYGRARAFRQGGDSEDTIAEAVATCPVDCIWYVSWDDLVALETERKYTVINPAARLVGGNFIEYQTTGGYFSRKEGAAESKASIMRSGEMRCNNCPSRGCKKCPLYGVGENPEYLKRKAAREAKRGMRTSARIDLSDGDDSSSLSQMIYSDSITDTSSSDFSA